MAQAYSRDLRERAVAAVAEGRSRHAVAKLFRVSAASVIRWSQRFQATGSAAAKPMGGVGATCWAGSAPGCVSGSQNSPTGRSRRCAPSWPHVVARSASGRCGSSAVWRS
jgi:hypothetical protein